MSSKMSLLEMVQNILSAMDSDEVNSISDTTESLQVAEVIRETFFEMFANTVELNQKGLVSLTGLGDLTRPNVMSIPDNCVNVDWIRYNGKLVDWIDPESFLQLGYTNTTIGYHGYYADRDPSWYTTFDNQTLVFDSYNANDDDTLQASKTVCWGQRDYEFELTDDFVPALEASRFPGFLAEAKSVCFTYFKQVSSTKDEQRSRRQRVRFQNNRWRASKEEYFDTPNYGRIRGGSIIRPWRNPTRT